MAKKKSLSKSKRTDADRRIAQADRLARVLRVLELIRGHGRWNRQALADEMECTVRTIQRYLAVLEYAGVIFWFDKNDQCYRVRSDSRFPALNLNEDELLGQVIASTIASAPGLDISKNSQATTRKLAATSDENASKLMDQAGQLVLALDMKLADHSRHREMIHTIQWALLRGKQLTGKYESPYQPKPVKLVLHPYRLCLMSQAWYLIGRTTKEDHPKTYRATRFSSIRLLDVDAKVPDDFDVGAYFGNAWGVYRGDKSYEVELLFTKTAAPLVTETRWHQTQKVERNQNGSATLRFKVDGLDEIIWWLLSWTGSVKVIQPSELRTMLTKRLQAGLKMNQDS